MHGALKALLVHEVTLAPLSATAGGGARSYGPERRVRARVEAEQRLVRDRQGREAASSTLVTLAPVDLTGQPLRIGLDDRLTLPEGFEPRTPPILSIHPCLGVRGGVEHYEVRL